MASGSSNQESNPSGSLQSAEETYADLLQQKKNGRAPYWEHLRVILVDDPKGPACKLQCKLCDVYLTTTNVSQTAKNHLKPNTCKGFPQQVGEENSSQVFKRAKVEPAGQKTMAAFTVPVANQRKSIQHLAKFFYSTNTALRLIEDPNLKEAFKATGVTLPGRTALGGSYLDSEYQYLMQPVADAIHQLEADKPILSQVHQVWNDLVQHAKAFENTVGSLGQLGSVVKVFEQRVKKHESAAWVASWVLDPANLVQGNGDKWRFPFPKLSPAESSSVADLLVRMVKDDKEDRELEIRQEITKLQLSPLPANLQSLAATVAERKEVNGKVMLMDAESRQGFWTDYLASQYPMVASAAAKLISLHATTCSSERNWSLWTNTYSQHRNRLGLLRGEKIIYIRFNSKDYKMEEDYEVAMDVVEE